MKLYPAIDIKNGQCVRLRQGKFEEINIYSEDPVDIARTFEDAGAAYIHLVDLDGALNGYAVNQKLIQRIVDSVRIPVQVGGGIRNAQSIEEKLRLGVNRVIIGTKAVEEPDFVGDVIRRYGSSRIVVGIDAKNGLVAVQGWGKVSKTDAVDLALSMKEMGVSTIIYTDIAKDGMLQGPNIEYTKRMVLETGMDIIASGGVSTMEDLLELEAIHVEGAIIGKALYEKRIDLKQAVDRFLKN